MSKLWRMFAAAVLTLAFGSASVQAQTAPPGWTITASATSWLAQSPDQGQSRRISLMFFPAARVATPIGAWLDAESTRHAQSVGRIAWSQPSVASEANQAPGGGALFSISRTVADRQGQNLHVHAYAYDTNGGRQLILLLKPATLPDNNGPYQSAINHLADAVHRGVAYASRAPSTSAAAAAPAPSTTAQTGRNCRREPLWRFRRSVFCKPTGICPDREIYDYETVCD